MRARALPVLLLIGLAALPLTARSKHNHSQSGSGSFDYYLLSLSWAPTWCGQDASRASSAECARGRHIGFIVHGLWPEAAQGKSPEFCGEAGRVPNSTVKIALPLMLSANLIQHEWAAHGTCSGLNSFDYFTALVQVRGMVQIPVQLNADAELTKTPADIELQFATANPDFPKGAFRTACTRGQFEEERVCFGKDLKPRACTSSVSECSDPRVKIPETL
jgi:ribonuclease T2